MPPSSWSYMYESSSKLTIAACSFCMASICKTLTMEAVCSTETSMNSYQTTRRYIPDGGKVRCLWTPLWEAQVQRFLTLLSNLHCSAFLSFPLLFPLFLPIILLCFQFFSGPRPFLYFRFKRQSAHPGIVRRSQHLTGVSRSCHGGRAVTSKGICSQSY